jgi:hypothetical protein
MGAAAGVAAGVAAGAAAGAPAGDVTPVPFGATGAPPRLFSLTPGIPKTVLPISTTPCLRELNDQLETNYKR